MYKFSMKGNSGDGSPWYDNIEGIQKAIETLDGFNCLLEERYKAGYEREEELRDFVILGRFKLDSCGNIGVATNQNDPRFVVPKEKVLTLDEYLNFVESQVQIDSRLGNVLATFSFGNNSIPPAKVVCPVCHKPWSTDNCHEVIILDDRHGKTIDLKDFVGQSLQSVHNFYALNTDGEYNIINVPKDWSMIRHDRFIDLTPIPGYETLVKNRNGWVGRQEGIDENYIIQPGDEADLHITRYLHPKCAKEFLALKEEKKFQKIFELAGYDKVIMERTENGYYGECDDRPPWFKVNVGVGQILIGWRKRVISIGWDKSLLHGKTVSQIFPKEDVTKGRNYIHAWSEEKCIEYLKKVRELSPPHKKSKVAK